MSRTWKCWPAGLMALGLALGCKHTQPQAEEGCTNCGATPTPAQAQVLPDVAGPIAVPRALAPVTPAPLELVPAPRANLDAAKPPTVTARPVITTPPSPTPTPAATTPPAPAVAPPAPPVNPEQSAPPARREILPKASVTPNVNATPKTEAVSSHRTTVPAPKADAVSPQYYNSPDYSILFGVLDYNPRRGTWRLRYADFGDEDRYGGSVTLEGVSRQMDGFTAGQFVRVEGGLVDADAKGVSPAYRVKDLRPAGGR
jgi:hypothetical protein